MKEWIEPWANEHKYDFFSQGNKPKALIIGEIHHDREQRAYQEELLQRLQPVYLLHERAGLLEYDPQTRTRTIPFGRKVWSDEFGFPLESDRPFEDQLSIDNHVLAWSDTYKIYIIGCDLSTDEMNVAAHTLAHKSPDLYTIDEDGTSVFDKEDNVLVADHPAIMSVRNEHMGTIIADNALRKSPVLAIVGAKHAEEENELHTTLQARGVSYIALAPKEQK